MAYPCRMVEKCKGSIALKKRGPPRTRDAAVTAPERTFCREYALDGDAVRAVVVAYPERAGEPEVKLKARARSMLSTSRVKRELEAIRALATQDAAFEVSDALTEFLAIYRADPNALVSVRVGCCRHCHGLDGRYQWGRDEFARELERVVHTRSLLRLKGKPDAELDVTNPLPEAAGGTDYDPNRPPRAECEECGGDGVARSVLKDTVALDADGKRLFQGVKMTKYGPEVQIADRMAALVNAARIIGAFEDRVRINAEVKTTQAVAVIHSDMSPIQAADVYRLVMGQGVDVSGGKR